MATKVWKFFNIIEVSQVCPDVSLAYSGGTGNLWQHVEAKHHAVLADESPSSAKRKQLTFRSCSSERSKDSIAEYVARDLRPIAVVDGCGF